MIVEKKLSLVEYVALLHKEPLVLVYVLYKDHLSDHYEAEFRPGWVQQQYMTLPADLCIIVLDIVESEAVYAKLCTDEKTQIRATPTWLFYSNGTVINKITLYPYFNTEILTEFFDTCVDTVLHPPPQPMTLNHRPIIHQRWTPSALLEAMKTTIGYALLSFSYGVPDISQVGQLAMTYFANLPVDVQVFQVDAKQDADVFAHFRQVAGLTSVPSLCLFKTRAVPMVSATGTTHLEEAHDPMFVLGFSAAHVDDDAMHLYHFICEVEMRVLETPNVTAAAPPAPESHMTMEAVVANPEAFPEGVRYPMIDVYLEDMAFHLSLATYTRHRSSIRRILGSHDLKTLERCCSADKRPEKKDAYIALFQEWARANYRMVYGKAVLPASWTGSPSKPTEEGGSEPESPTTVPPIAEGVADDEDDEIPVDNVRVKPQRRVKVDDKVVVM